MFIVAVALQDRQVVVQLRQLTLISRRYVGPVDVNPVGHLERFGAAFDGQLDWVQAGPQIDVRGIYLVARLSVAEVPMGFGIGLQGRRRRVGKLDPDQRHLAVGQWHIGGDLDQEIGYELFLSRGDRAGIRAADCTGAKSLRRNRLRLRLGLFWCRLPSRDHHGLRTTGGVVVFEPVCTGRQVHGPPDLGPGSSGRSMAARRLHNNFAVDQQETAVLAGGKETIVATLVDSQRARIATEKRPGRKQQGVKRMLHRVDVVGPDLFRRFKRLLDRFETVEIAVLIFPNFQQEAVCVGPRRDCVGFRRLAAVEDLVGILSRYGLQRQPAIIARAHLEHPRGEGIAAAIENQHVTAVGCDLAMVEELDDGNGKGSIRRQAHRPHGVELSPPSTECLRRGLYRGDQRDCQGD